MTGRAWNETFGDLGMSTGAQLTQLPLTVLDPWVDVEGRPQPFKPYTEAEIQDMAENVRANGIIEPIRARPRPGGRFQILAGHNRVEAARRAGLTTVPAIVEDVDDAQAAVLLVDSNLKHREKLLPSELAFAYKLRLESIKRQGQRTDLTSAQIAPKLSTEIIGESAGISKDAVKRYIRLTKLIPSLLDKVDAGTLGLTVGVDLSYLSQEAQAMLVRIMEEHGIKKIKGSQSAELKAAGKDPTGETILRVLGISGEEKESFPSLSIKPDLSAYPASTVKLLKKSSAYMTGLQLAVQRWTDQFIQDNGLDA